MRDLITFERTALAAAERKTAQAHGTKFLNKYLRLLAHPARFELTASAFGGQFLRIADVCKNLTLSRKFLILRYFIVAHV